MPDLPTVVLFVATSTLLLIVPGPTITLVIARSLSRGRRVALPLVLGAGLGDLVAGSLSLAGAGALLAASVTAFTLAEWLGAACLIWLGVRLFRAEPTLPAIDAVGPETSAGTSRDGLRLAATVLERSDVRDARLDDVRIVGVPVGDLLDTRGRRK